MPNEFVIPDFSLVMLIGPAASGKSTLAQRHFQPTEIVSSDQCRLTVSDDIQDQTASADAFDLLHKIVDARLKRRRLTVADATNLQPEHRKTIIDIARQHDCPAVAVVMETSLRDCLDRAAARAEKVTPAHAVRRQHHMMRQHGRRLSKEGFSRVFHVKNQAEADAVTFQRRPAISDKRELDGPFDIVGDVHGCYDELVTLLDQLGYDTGGALPVPPEGRALILLGDLVDRGPASDKVLELAMGMTAAGHALCLLGNHEDKLRRKLQGNAVTVSHGLAATLEQLGNRPPEFSEQVQEFLKQCGLHYVLDGGKLAVAHAGVIAAYQNRYSRRIRDFCLYGQTNGERDEWNRPVRLDWAQDYRGDAMVVYGHTAVTEAQWVNNTICVDTGCVFGGQLTALRYPEQELVSVPATREYYPAIPQAEADAEPEAPAPPAKQRRHKLSMSDFTGRTVIETRTHGTVIVPAERNAAALESVSRYALNSQWLVYIPPTMAPVETARDRDDLLEHPAQAFAQYRKDGVDQVICQEKHMGSRGILILGRDPDALAERFGVPAPHGGVCYSRTGRQFFTRPEVEAQVMAQARRAATDAGLWTMLDTGWLVMDCEIMPWSLKAGELIRRTYAPTGAAAGNTLDRAATLLAQAKERGIAVDEALSRTLARQEAALRYRNAYRQYCWATDDSVGVKIAPFHIMAGEGRVYADRPHSWHMNIAGQLTRANPELFQTTAHRIVSLDDETEQAGAILWWQQMTAQGGEGMVVKPADFIPPGRLAQPAVKVRGKNYLSIIYGPEYDLPANLPRMRGRNTRTKRQLAVREFALGIEGLHRFVDREPHYRVHQCAYSVLALESEPIDPRL